MSDKDPQAFEFVLGTLSPEERAAFKAKHSSEQALDEDLHFWENQLSELNNINDTLQPKADTWNAIQKAITPSHSDANTASQVNSKQKWLNWLPWGISMAMSFALVITLSLGRFDLPPTANAPIDYVAVLTDDSGQAKLTAMTEANSKSMWLQWGDITLESDKTLQIWALSKTDQQIRSIAVLDNKETLTVQLSNAHWRLIKDADSLILTTEEKGGSALDEPSEVVLAKGICVRLNHQEKTS
jgi:anti-sigma-K factor RskA